MANFFLSCRSLCLPRLPHTQGTSSIVHETTHQPLLSTLSSIVETVIRLKNDGHRVVLVSSGAIGVGLKRMDLDKRPTNLSKKQVNLFFLQYLIDDGFDMFLC